MNLDASLAPSAAFAWILHGLFFLCSTALLAFFLRYRAFLRHLWASALIIIESDGESLNSEVLGFCFAVLGLSSGVFVFGSAACFRSAVWIFSSVATGL